MRIYQNTRNFRVLVIVWISAIAFAASVAFGFQAWRNQNMQSLDNWFVIGLLSYMMFVAIEFYARRYVTSLDVKDGRLVLTTKSLLGRHTIIDYGQLDQQNHDKGLKTGTAVVISALTSSLDALRFSGIDNKSHILKVGRQRTRYIVDVTADPSMSDAIANTLNDLESDPEIDRTLDQHKTLDQPSVLAKLKNCFTPWVWGFLHAVVMLIVIGLYTDKTNIQFYQNNQQATATITEKSQKRAGSNQRGAMQYFVHISFESTDKKQTSSRKKVKFEKFTQLNVGDKIPVWYLPNEPTYNALTKQFDSDPGIAWFVAVIAGFIALGFFLNGFYRIASFNHSITGILLQLGLLITAFAGYAHFTARFAFDAREVADKMEDASNFYFLGGLVLVIAGLSWAGRLLRLRWAKAKVPD